MKNILVSTSWLNDNLENSNLRLFDCSVLLRPAIPGPYTAESGLAAYNKEHIPGAGFADLTSEFSNRNSDLRFMMPQQEQMQAALSSLGINSQHRVVFYSATLPMWATRLYWMLCSSGHDNVSVLNGGFSKWKAERRPISTEASSYSSVAYKGKSVTTYWSNCSDVISAIDSNKICLLNALAPDVFSGKSEKSYGRKGHIPGSKNIHYATLYNKDGTFKTGDELSHLFQIIEPSTSEQTICYCGGGISATVAAFALHLLGHSNISVYDGSMSDWVRDPLLPLVLGDL